MLSAIGLGSISEPSCSRVFPPTTPPPPHSSGMCVFAAIGLLFSLSTTPALSLMILVACGCFWLLSLNPSNTPISSSATDANRGRVLSVMLLAQQGGMPLGHLCADF